MGASMGAFILFLTIFIIVYQYVTMHFQLTPPHHFFTVQSVTLP